MVSDNSFGPNSCSNATKSNSVTLTAATDPPKKNEDRITSSTTHQTTVTAQPLVKTEEISVGMDTCGNKCTNDNTAPEIAGLPMTIASQFNNIYPDSNGNREYNENGKINFLSPDASLRNVPSKARFEMSTLPQLHQITSGVKHHNDLNVNTRGPTEIENSENMVRETNVIVDTHALTNLSSAIEVSEKIIINTESDHERNPAPTSETEKNEFAILNDMALKGDARFPSDVTNYYSANIPEKSTDNIANIRSGFADACNISVAALNKPSSEKSELSPLILQRSCSTPVVSEMGDKKSLNGQKELEPPRTTSISMKMSDKSVTTDVTTAAAAIPPSTTYSHSDYKSSCASEDDEADDPSFPYTLQQSTIVEKSPAERYIRFKEKLGSGAYKDVYRAYDTIEGIEVAWNVVKLGGVPKAERIRIVNEVRLLERLHHPNIISFHGSWVNRETERVIFVTEILSSGTLKSFVQKVQLIRWKIFKRWAIQILKGLEYLHMQDPPIIHRDLKCDNIFINGTSGDLRIGDFGLSTAISKNNQPLSVLGTPEFMAPELYDENYNEKVDIYAFGMLLLEIITNQVPYNECMNPAQIYKKVTQGIPPASLRRVKSEHAKNFILLCLGIDKDASARPSATELLNHPFLTKRANDDEPIEVEPAVKDIVIDELATFDAKVCSLKDEIGVSLTISDTCSERSFSEKVIDQQNKLAGLAQFCEQDTPKDESTVSSKTSEKMGVPVDTDQVEAYDHFEVMPQNEANMKKVTVLMGRGTALDDKEVSSTQSGMTSLPSIAPVVVSLPPQTVRSTLSKSVSEADASSLGSASHYKVSIVPRCEVPFPVNTIKLALTLPDEGLTTIEFDFDLMNDDPVLVAREMVVELDEVPNDAVLDISEAISAISRQIMRKQNQWTQIQQQHNFLSQQQSQQSMQQQQQGMMVHSYGGMMPPQGTPQGVMIHQHQQPAPGVQQQFVYGSGISGLGIQTSSSILPSHLDTGNDASSAFQRHHQQLPHIPCLTSDGSNLGVGNDSQVLDQQKPPLLQNVSFQTPGGTFIGNQQLGDIQLQQNVGFQFSGGSLAPHHFAENQPTQQQVSFQQHPRVSSDLSVQQQPQPMHPAPLPYQMQVQHQSLPPRSVSTPQLTQQIVSHPPVSTSNSVDTLMSSDDGWQQKQQSLSDYTLSERFGIHSQEFGSHNIQHGLVSSLPYTVTEATHPPQMVVVKETTEVEEDLDDVNDVDSEEIRKLNEEFEKKLQRAKKSFGTRMDNLHRSKVEAEAQHQMTLEKHEKERMEFEKRVRLAEEEQNRRLCQIEKEFHERKHLFRQHRASQSHGDRPPLHGAHKRSISHFESSSQRHTIATDHKRNNSTQSSHSCSDSSDDNPSLDRLPSAPSSGGVSLGEIKRQCPSILTPVQKIESNPSLKDMSHSTS